MIEWYIMPQKKGNAFSSLICEFAKSPGIQSISNLRGVEIRTVKMYAVIPCYKYVDGGRKEFVVENRVIARSALYLWRG